MAGKGVRLLPFTAQQQKALLPVGGKTVLDYLIEPLIDGGVTEFSMVVGYRGDQVRDHMERYTHVDTVFVQQEEQLGLGHAVLQGLSNVSKPVLIALSDTIFECDFASLIQQSGNVIGVVEVEDPQRFGIVETVGSQIVDMVEKPFEPVSNLAIAGLYRIENQAGLKEAIERLVADNLTTKGEYQLTDALKLMLDAGEVFTTAGIDAWLDCGTPETLLTTNSYLLQKAGAAYIHPSASVERSTIRFSSVGAGCTVRGSTVNNCILLPGAHLEDCVLHDEIVPADATLIARTSVG